ncbi:M20/M25/M40 family metallo-hydrolase [Staphylococcus xylosus]|uniref:M20/M25/M40 family metallo-hydrolase n=1 Tax=Staphylococcus xylosus TaxID=1288 RepID=UPI003F560604
MAKKIAEHPRVPGGEYHKYTQQYIKRELESLNIYQKSLSYNTYVDNDYYKGHIDLTNIIGHIKGKKDNNNSIAIMAHYDSVKSGPGASDNAVNVASLLELSKKLKSENTNNDIYFIFTDGEELGTLGAKKLWDNKSFTKKIDMVINLEARGTSGPSFMFETSPNNGNIVQDFGHYSKNSLSNSLISQMYKITPNDTDLSVSIDKDIAGVNFAFFENWKNYHNKKDNIHNLDINSVKNQGDNALNYIEQIKDKNLNNYEALDRIYFSLGPIFIQYKEKTAIYLSFILVLVSLILFIFNRYTMKPIVKISSVIISFIIGNILLNIAIAYLFYSFLPDFFFLDNGYVLYQKYLFGIISLGTIISMLLFLKKIMSIFTYNSILMAVIAISSILNLLTSLLIPGVSYLLALPTLTLMLFYACFRSKKINSSSILLYLFPLIIPSILFINVLLIFYKSLDLFNGMIAIPTTLLLFILFLNPMIYYLIKKQ